MVDMGKDTPAKNRKSLKGKKSLGGDPSDVVIPTPKKQNQNKLNGATPKSAVKDNKRKSVAGPLDSSLQSDNSESSPKKQKLEKPAGPPTNASDAKKKKSDKLKAKRKENRKEYFEKLEQLKAGGTVDSTFLEKIAKKIAELEQRPEKTATAKKKLRKFRYIYKLAVGGEAPKAAKQEKADVKKTPAKQQQKTPQKQQKKTPQKQQGQKKTPQK